VAAAFFEFGGEIVGPVCSAGFPTVVDDVLEATLAHEIADSGLIIVEIGGHVGADVIGVEFIDFEASAFGGGGMIGDSGERIAHAEDDPVAGGGGAGGGAAGGF